MGAHSALMGSLAAADEGEKRGAGGSGWPRQFRVADATFAQESRRRTARPLLSLFASCAVGGAPREDAPARTQGPARIF